MIFLDAHEDKDNNIYLANPHTIDTIKRINYTKNNGVSRAQAERQLQGQLNGQKVFKIKTVGETEIILSHETLAKLTELTKDEDVIHED